MNKHVVYLSLGTNLGSRLDNLKHALESLTEFCQVVAASSIYETDPWGFEDQPIFYNQVVKIETALEPIQLLQEIKEIELEMGRVPTFQYGPRLIDIDILLYDELVINSPLLKDTPSTHEITRVRSHTTGGNCPRFGLTWRKS